MEATVEPYAVDAAARSSEMVPPVEVYRTDDLPVSGAMSESVDHPIETVLVPFTHIGDGRFRGQVVLSEPGSYTIVSMGMWEEVQGYPAPISLTVTDAGPPDAATPNASGVQLGWGMAAVVGAALVGGAMIRRRHRLSTA